MDTAPFISIDWSGRDCHVRGQHACEIGHRIERTGSAVADGIYCGWHWDGTRLVAHNDRYGMFPLFYCQTGNRLLVSPCLTALLARGASSELDHEALCLFLHFGVYLGESTPFAGIRALPPAATFHWQHGLLSCEGRYLRAEPRSLSRRDAVDEFITLFRQAVARRAPAGGRYAVPLSGGYDSRFILLELWRQGHRDPLCITSRHAYYQRDPNVDLATALSGRLGLRHQVVESPASPVASSRVKNRRTHFCSTEHEWYLSIDALLGQEFQSVYDGIAGDMTTDILGHGTCTQETSQRYEAGDLESVSRQLLGGPENALRRVLIPDFLDRCDGSKVRQLLHAELEKHIGAPNPVSSFFFWNRTRRAVALVPYGLLSRIPRVYSPFLDWDLFDFLTSLPWRDVADNHLRAETIRRAYPEFADLPFADHPSAAAPSELARRRYDRRYAQELLGHLIGKLRRNRSIARRGPLVGLLAGASTSGALATRYAWVFDRLVYLLQLEELGAG